jgi:hypothetical protein
LTFLDCAAITIEADIVEGRRIAWCVSGLARRLASVRKPPHHAFGFGDKPHHYQITVFAVDVDKLPDAKDESASAALVGFDLHFHTLAKATLTGLYGR